MDSPIKLSLMLILAFNSKAHAWNVSVARHFNVTSGSTVIIPCTFSYPHAKHGNNIQVFWKQWSIKKIAMNDKDRNPFIFHPNDTFILEKYRGRTELIGNKNEGDCSLKIRNITDNERHIYLRVSANGNYSFYKNNVSISVSGATPVITDPGIIFVTGAPTEITPMDNATMMYTGIFVSLAAVLIIIFVAGIVCCRKHTRSQFTRQESGYYVNFKAPSIPAKRETSIKKQDSKHLPELKVIDDPVYINLEAPPVRTHQSMDHADNIYANVDYTK